MPINEEFRNPEAPAGLEHYVGIVNKAKVIGVVALIAAGIYIAERLGFRLPTEP